MIMCWKCWEQWIRRCSVVCFGQILENDVAQVHEASGRAGDRRAGNWDSLSLILPGICETFSCSKAAEELEDVLDMSSENLALLKEEAEHDRAEIR